MFNEGWQTKERLHKEAILLFDVSALTSDTPCFDDTTRYEDVKPSNKWPDLGLGTGEALRGQGGEVGDEGNRHNTLPLL